MRRWQLLLVLLLHVAHGLVELAEEEPPEPELPRSGLGSTHLRQPVREGDHAILVSSMHGLKVGHAVRLDAELSCTATCSEQQPWSERCLLCACAACEQCAEGSPYHRGDPAECRGPGAAEYAEVRAFGEDGKLYLGEALHTAHAAGAPVRLLPAYACPLNCAGHGSCIEPAAVCQCEPGWLGAGCDRREEPPEAPAVAARRRSERAHAAAEVEAAAARAAAAAAALPSFGSAALPSAWQATTTHLSEGGGGGEVDGSFRGLGARFGLGRPSITLAFPPPSPPPPLSPSSPSPLPPPLLSPGLLRELA